MPPRLLPAHVEILLFCDSAKLAHLIEMILHPSGHFQTILIDQPAPWPTSANPLELILVAFSKPANEPLSVLSRAGLTQWVGRRPILLIMPSPFLSQPDELIWCLEFPVEAQTLSDRVAEILSLTAGLKPPAVGGSPPG